MEYIKPQTKKTKKVVTKLSNSGRLITMNKKYLTTESSEDADVIIRQKRKSDTATVGSELARLKSIHQSMQLKKQKLQNETLSSDAVDNRSDNTSKSVDAHSTINRSNLNLSQNTATQSTKVINVSNVASDLALAQDTTGKMGNKSEIKSQVTSKNHVHGSIRTVKSKPNDPSPTKNLITSQRNVNEAASNSANSNTAFCRPVARIDHEGPSFEIPFQQRNTPIAQGDSNHQTNIDANAIVEIFDGASQGRIEELFKQIQEQNNKIMQQNVEILEKLLNIEKENGKITEDRLYEPLKGFPLRTIDEFENLDSKPNKAKRNELYNHLLLLGGSKLRDFLRSALQKVMTDELVGKFKWIKTADSVQFGNTRVANVLFRAATDCPVFRGPTSKKEFKDEILDLLRVTKQRYRNSVKELKAKKQTTDADEELILQEIRRLEERAQEERHDESQSEEAFADDELDGDEAYERNN